MARIVDKNQTAKFLQKTIITHLKLEKHINPSTK